MESARVRQLNGDSVIVPFSVWQRMEQICNQMPELLSRIETLEAVTVTGSEYLSRKQAMDFLHVGSTKLWELMGSGDIETSKTTGKTLYLTSSCRQYLASQGFSKEHVQNRFREILQNKQKK